MGNRRGWWRVRDTSGEIQVRAWSRDTWWTPLIGGWIDSPPGYEKLEFICDMEPPESNMDPIEEWQRAVERAKARR